MNEIIKYLNRLPSFIRNKYFISALAFMTWMVFFDDNNIIQQVKISRQLSDIKEKINFYKKETAKVNSEKNLLFSSSNNLERYAREQYKMKKADEDIFIITEVPQ